MSKADYVHNLTIINNTIHNCNYLSKAAAAIMLHGDGHDPMHGNANIIIKGLAIANTTPSNLYMGASEAVSLGDVDFVDVYDIDYLVGINARGCGYLQRVTRTRCIERNIGKHGRYRYRIG